MKIGDHRNSLEIDIETYETTTIFFAEITLFFIIPTPGFGKSGGFEISTLNIIFLKLSP